MGWLIFWIVLYLLVIIILSLRHLKTSDIDQYLVNNRSTKTLPLVFTVLATFVGGGTSIGLMALGYESGFAAVAIGVAYVIGFGILWKYAGSIRDFGAKKNIYSFPHFLNHTYTSSDDKSFAKIFSATVSGVNIFIFFFILAAQFVAMASLLKFSFEIGYTTAVIISTLIIITYTAVAGLSGVIITDTIQFIAIVIMIFLIFIPGIITDTETFSKLSELPSEMLNGTQLGIVFLVGTPIFLSWSVLARMDIWQRILAAKDDKVARKVSLWSGLGMLPFYIIFPMVGMAVRLVIDYEISPDETASVAYLFIDRHSSGFLMAFAIVGLLSALMSSGDSFLNIISISAVKDFVGWSSSKTVSPQKTHRHIRVATFVFGITALFMALIFPNIVDLMVVGISTITIFAPITLFALVKKDAHRYRKTVIISLLVAFFINLALFIWGLNSPESFNPKSSFVPSIIIETLILLSGMKLTDMKLKNSK
jgi:solute:Na+ symporter, SSS family